MRTVLFGANAEQATIGNSAFESCVSLEEVELPQNAITLGAFAFDACENLKRVVLPAALQSVGRTPFRDCPLLLHLQCLAPTPPAIQLPLTRNVHPECATEVPATAVALYAAQEGWPPIKALQ